MIPTKDKLFSSIGFKKEYILGIFIFFIVILAYFVPTLIFQKAFGTDVYTHMVYTRDMFQTNSLFEFYESHPKLDYGEYNYPFGLWMLGSIIAIISSSCNITPYNHFSLLQIRKNFFIFNKSEIIIYLIFTLHASSVYTFAEL